MPKIALPYFRFVRTILVKVFSVILTYRIPGVPFLYSKSELPSRSIGRERATCSFVKFSKGNRQGELQGPVDLDQRRSKKVNYI